MAPATSEKIFKVFPIISLWELYVTHGSLSPSYRMCFKLNLIRTDIYTNTLLKMEADDDNRPSIYSLSYLTSAFNSGELKQCDQKLGFRL